VGKLSLSLNGEAVSSHCKGCAVRGDSEGEIAAIFANSLSELDSFRNIFRQGIDCKQLILRRKEKE
jgi:hypothetical protein